MLEHKFTKYQNTEYNRYKRLESSLKNVFSMTISFRLPISEYLKLRDEKVYNTRDYSKLTNYYRGVLQGKMDSFHDSLYRYHLKFCYAYQGKVMHDYNDFMSPSELAELYKNDNDCTCTHYWIESLNLDKLYTPIEKARPWGDNEK